MNDRILEVASQTRLDGAVVLSVAGELDHHTSPRLAEVVDRTPFAFGARVVIDLSGMVYCDSTGMTVLVTAYQRAQATESRLILAGASGDLMRVFRVIGLDQIFTFRPTVEEAIQAFEVGI